MSPRRTRSRNSGKKYLNHNSYSVNDKDHADEVVKSSRRKRAPARYSPNEDEDLTQSRGRRKSQQLEEEDDDNKEDNADNEEDDEHDDEVEIRRPNRGRGRSGRGSGRPKRPFLEESIDEDDDEDDEDFQAAPRRSTRERKMIYSTMNQSLLGNYYSSE